MSHIAFYIRVFRVMNKENPPLSCTFIEILLPGRKNVTTWKKRTSWLKDILEYKFRLYYFFPIADAVLFFILKYTLILYSNFPTKIKKKETSDFRIKIKSMSEFGAVLFRLWACYILNFNWAFCLCITNTGSYVQGEWRRDHFLLFTTWQSPNKTQKCPG